MQILRIIGIGNHDRGDDAAGLCAAARLARERHAGTIVQEHAGDGASLIELWGLADRVMLIDAVVSGASAGTIHRLDLLASPLPSAMMPVSTHAFGVREGIELARALGKLPSALLFIGIEGQDFSPGRGLSGPVEAALETVVRSLRHTATDAGQ